MTPPANPQPPADPQPPAAARFWFTAEPETDLFKLGLEEGFLETLSAEIVGLELAPVNTTLHAGDTFGMLTLATHAIDLRAPQAFKIIAVNETAEQDPRLVRHSPYARGWLLKVQL